MSKLKKRLAALGVGLAVMATSVASLGTSAADIDSWPAYYTPYTGSFLAGPESVRVSGVKWTSSQLTQMAESFHLPACPVSMEFEFRPYSPNNLSEHVNPHTIWGGKRYCTSNLPSVYYEFQSGDPDDVAICTADVTACQPNASYYGTMEMYLKDKATCYPYIFETELGYYVGAVDESMPTRYAQHTMSYFGPSYSW